MPSETTLQQQYGIARDTARHALRLLREAGLIVSVGAGELRPQALTLHNGPVTRPEGAWERS
nr:GntR family transcriptional regulator [Actinoplanes italicus]